MPVGKMIPNPDRLRPLLLKIDIFLIYLNFYSSNGGIFCLNKKQ